MLGLDAAPGAFLGTCPAPSGQGPALPGPEAFPEAEGELVAQQGRGSSSGRSASLPLLRRVLGSLFRGGALSGGASALGSGRDPRVPGLSPASGSLQEACFSLCLGLCLSLCLYE